MIQEKLTAGEHIALMQVYLNELTFRDNLLWSQTYKLFYATVIVIVLPFLKIGDISAWHFPGYMFNIAGVFMSIAFFFVTKEFAKRLKAASDIYNKLIEQLPEEYRRKSILNPGWDEKGSKSISYRIIPGLFLSLVIINLLILFFTLFG